MGKGIILNSFVKQLHIKRAEMNLPTLVSNLHTDIAGLEAVKPLWWLIRVDHRESG